MKKFGPLIIVAAWIASSPLVALEIEGVVVPPTQTVAGKELKLNGAGVRAATVLRVKVYVASFYAPQPMTSEKDVFASEGPFRFDFTFLRAFPKEKVVNAWVWQFEQSGDHVYPQFQGDLARFVNSFGALKKGGVETIEIEGDKIRVIDQGNFREMIVSEEFKKAFLGIWFGRKPVQDTLKKALLGGKTS